MNGGSSASLPYSGLVGATFMTTTLNTPPAASRSSCHRSRSAVTVSPLHHHSGAGENARDGSANPSHSSAACMPPDARARRRRFATGESPFPSGVS